jgi:hypothetical protein
MHPRRDATSSGQSAAPRVSLPCAPSCTTIGRGEPTTTKRWSAADQA